MSVETEFTIDTASIARMRDAAVARYHRAAQEAVKEATSHLERRLEEATRGSVGGNLWRAWASRYYRNRGDDPAGIVYVKGSDRAKGAMAFWTRPGVITGSRGQLLAIPSDAVPRRGRFRQPMTPKEWEAAFGQKLRLVVRRGRAPVLVADGVTSAQGRYRPLTRRRSLADQRRGFVRRQTTIVLYTLKRSQEFGNAFRIEPAFEEAERRLVEEFVVRVGASG